ncbi:hypothetical protein HN784_03430 [bacterium]|nr:hypothetical protein [bacterium]MBT6754105.1 hypothetical protein [bacterium]MBT7037925.1 hypothetical protein [bacterium]MBT7431867.1 hypothetical protein [bacterium]MBT7993154.1 hypothetical protein [bacterium]
MSKKVAVMFMLIMLLGGSLRLYKLGMQSFIADEFLGIKISTGYNKTGEWKHWDFNTNAPSGETYTRGKVYYWQVSKLLNILPTSEANSRLVSVVWGMIAMITVFLATFFITRSWTIALIALFLSAMSITELAYDRKLRMYSMFAPVYLWFSFAVFKFLEYKKDSKCAFFGKFCKAKKGAESRCVITRFSQKTGLDWMWFLPSLILGFLSLKTHDLTVNIVPTILVYLLVMGLFLFFKKKQKNNHYLRVTGIFVLSGLALISILPFLKTIPIIGYILQKAVGATSAVAWVFHPSYLQKVTLDYSYILFGIFFISIGAYLMIRKYGKIGLWTVLSFLVPLVLAIFTWKRNVGDQYIYLTQLFKVIVVACGIYFVSQGIAKLFKNTKKVFMLVLGLILLLLVNFSFFYSEHGFYQSVKEWQHSNYREVFDYFLEKKGENVALFARPLTNYYLRGNNTKLLPYGEDNQLTALRIFEAQNEYDELWVIFSKNTNIKGDAKRLMEREFKLVETKYTNKKVKVYRWKKNHDKLKIGFVTDSHCYAKQDKESKNWELNWRCKEPMTDFVNKMNDEFKPDMVIEGGDLVDGRDDNAFWDFKEVKGILEKANAPVYHVLGNHETRSFPKKDWLDLTENKKTYYKIDIKGFRVIVLDANFTAKGEDTTPIKESYAGVINQEQLEWLKETLIDAEDLRKIVFVHQPPIETDARKQSELFKNSEELRSLLSKFSVEAVFSGHIERFCKTKLGTDTDYYVLQGFWKQNGRLKEEFKYPEAGTFSEITIGKDIEVSVNYREKDETEYNSFIMNSDNSSCEDGNTVISRKLRDDYKNKNENK